MVAKFVDKNKIVRENDSCITLVNGRESFQGLEEHTSHNSIYVNSGTTPGFDSANEILLCPRVRTHGSTIRD